MQFRWSLQSISQSLWFTWGNRNKKHVRGKTAVVVVVSTTRNEFLLWNPPIKSSQRSSQTGSKSRVYLHNYTNNYLWNPCPCQVEIDRLADLFDLNSGVTITTWKYCTNTVKIGKVAYLLSWEGGGSDVWAEHTSWRHYYCKSVPSCNRSVNLRTGQSISDDNASQVSLQHRYKVGVGAEH